MLDVLTSLLGGLPAWQATVVVLALSLAGALLTEFVVLRAARELVAHTETHFDNILLQELRVPLVVTVGLAGVFLLTQVPSVVASVVVTQSELDTFFGKPSLAVIVVVWAWALNQIVNRFVEEVKDRGDRFDFAPIFSNVWTLVVVVGTLAALLTLYDIDITPLLGAAGVAGIAVGFAAKDTVSNFFGGIALYFDDTYKLGDFVVLDSGEAGSVVKVGIRSTTLLTRDEVLITVPNSVLNAAKIVNESAPQRRRRIRVPIGVAYGTDIDAFEALVVQLALDEPLVLDSPKPRMRFRSFGDSALSYELLCWVSSPTRRRRAQHELNRAIYKALTEAGIEIPYPKRDVTMAAPERHPTATAETDADAGASPRADVASAPRAAGDTATDGRAESGGGATASSDRADSTDR